MEKTRAFVDEEAKDQYIINYLPLVRYVANKLDIKTSSQVDVKDLMSYGVFGLIDAAEKFNPSRGASFQSYAILRIRGAILDGLRKTDWVPRAIRKLKKQVDEAHRELEQDLGRPVTTEEVAEKLDMNVEQYHATMEKVKGHAIESIEQMTERDSFGTGDKEEFTIVEEDEKANPFFNVYRNELKRVIADAIEGLPENERLVVSLYYFDEMTMHDIGYVLELTESRVSQLHARALLKLKSRIEEALAHKKAKIKSFLHS